MEKSSTWKMELKKKLNVTKDTNSEECDYLEKVFCENVFILCIFCLRKGVDKLKCLIAPLKRSR